MERLAAGSMLFTDAYTASPLCSPTRASLMTGQHPARVGITTAVGHRPPLDPDESRYPERAAPSRPVLLPESRRFLRPEQYTIAEALGDAGYRTAHIGKWHLGLNPEHWPEEQGFELSFHGAPDPGPRSYFSPYQFRAGTVTDGPEGEYIADRVTDEALKFIDAHRDEPFLLDLWHYNVHGPWGHKEELTATYRGREDPRGQQNNPIMASMLKSVDESLGRVLDRLDELQLTDDTIFIFFSDNGGNVHSEIGPDKLPPTNNHPLRAGKGSLYEGGSRVPLLVRWPGVVEPRSRCSEVVSSIDFYPTLLEMAGVEPKPGHIMDGESITPLLRQTGRLKREAIFCYFPHGGPARPPGVWVRRGDWKLLRFYETSEQFPDEYELYNLKDDIGETANLAGEMPGRVRELDALINGFLKDTGALLPIPNPAYDPMTAALRGWVNKGCEVSVADGTLKMQCAGGNSFLATASLRHAGPAVVRFRARSAAGGPGKIQWRTADQPQFVAGHIVPFELPADGQWHEVAVRLSVRGTLVHVRLYPAARAGLVEIDWIRLCEEDGAVVREWDY
jgi:arylsulfatase A-like enzyme